MRSTLQSLMGWCCPCILFGKTKARIEDPSLANYSPINENCLIWCGLSCCSLNYLIQPKKRDDLRKKYGINEAHLERLLNMESGNIKRKHEVEGSMVKDYLGAFCCRCCGLMQEEKKVLRQLQQTGPGGEEGYQRTKGMGYP
ncbi:hypothetical protein BDV06DRAFT_219761 [Aspergillus oleicola]